MIGWFFFPRIFAAAMMVVTLVVLTRLLGADEFGRYNMAITAGTIAYAVLLGWVSVALSRFHRAAQFDGRASAEILGAMVCFLLSLIPLALLLVGMVPSEAVPFVALAVAYFFAHSLYEIGLTGLRVLYAGPGFAAAALLRPVLGVGLGLVLIFGQGSGYQGALVGMIVASAVLGIAALWRTLRRTGIALPTRAFLPVYLSFGIPLAVASSATMVIALIAQGVIAGMEDFVAVGVYAAAQVLAMRTINMPMTMLAAAASVSIFDAFEKDGAAAADMQMRGYLSYLLLVSVPVTVVLTFASGTVSTVLFGEALAAQVAKHLPVLALAAFVSGLQGAFFSFAFTISRRTGIQALILLAMVVLHAVASVVLVYRFGAIGASWALLLAAAFSLVAFAQVGARLSHRVRVPWDQLRPLGPALAVFVPFALWADRLDQGLTSSVTLAVGGVLFLAVLHLRGFPAMRRISQRLVPGFARP